jgi:hypothetical protein
MNFASLLHLARELVLEILIRWTLVGFSMISTQSHIGNTKTQAPTLNDVEMAPKNG